VRGPGPLGLDPWAWTPGLGPLGLGPLGLALWAWPSGAWTPGPGPLAWTPGPGPLVSPLLSVAGVPCAVSSPRLLHSFDEPLPPPPPHPPPLAAAPRRGASSTSPTNSSRRPSSDAEWYDHDGARPIDSSNHSGSAHDGASHEGPHSGALATVALPPPPPPAPWALPSATHSSAGTGSASGAYSGSTPTTCGAPSNVSNTVAFAMLPDENAALDVTLGSLLGWGSYGRVYRGGWRAAL